MLIMFSQFVTSRMETPFNHLLLLGDKPKLSERHAEYVSYLLSREDRTERAERIFAEVYTIYRDRTLRYAQAYGNRYRVDPDTSCDFASEIWIKFLFELKNVERQGEIIRDFFKWWCAAFRRKVIDSYRKKNSRKTDLTDFGSESEYLLGGNDDPIRSFEVNMELEVLPPGQKEVIKLTDEGYTATEISELLNIPVTTVKGRKEMARKKLKGLR